MTMAPQVLILVSNPSALDGPDGTRRTTCWTEPHVGELQRGGWTARVGLWSWLLQLRALPR